MERITRSHPQIRFEVKLLSGNTDRLYRDLQLRELDLVMSRIPEGAQREFKIDILYEDPMCVIAGVNSAWSRRKTVELSDIRDERWCLPSLSLPPWTKVADAFRSRGLDLPTSAVTTSSVPLLSKLVGSGQFLSILPYTVFHILANDLKARILPLDLNVKYPFGIATLLNRAISPSTALFIATARHVAGSMDAARSKLLAQLSKKASRIL